MANINVIENHIATEIIRDAEVVKVSYLAYLSAFIVGTLIPISGLASPQIAEHF